MIEGVIHFPMHFLLFNCNHLWNTFQSSLPVVTQSGIELLGNKLCQYISVGNRLQQYTFWQYWYISFGNKLHLYIFWQQTMSIHFIWQDTWKEFWVLISVASLEHCNEVSAEFFCPVKMCFEFAREANFRWIWISIIKMNFKYIKTFKKI